MQLADPSAGAQPGIASGVVPGWQAFDAPASARRLHGGPEMQPAAPKQPVAAAATLAGLWQQPAEPTGDLGTASTAEHVCHGCGAPGCCQLDTGWPLAGPGVLLHFAICYGDLGTSTFGLLRHISEGHALSWLLLFTRMIHVMFTLLWTRGSISRKASAKSSGGHKTFSIRQSKSLRRQKYDEPGFLTSLQNDKRL